MDIQEKRARHQRFWQPLEKGEGAYIGVTAPIDDSGTPPVPYPKPASVEERWLCSDYILNLTKAREKNIFWGLDAVHTEFVNMGAGVHAALLGAPYTLDMNTIWFDLDPPIKNWDTMPVFKTDSENPLYKAIEAHTKILCEYSNGRIPISHTDIGGQMDVLFSLRGEELLIDLIEEPEIIEKAQAQLDDEFLNYFNHLTGIIKAANSGFTGWIPVVHDLPWYPLQCDMSVMISPKMFERFAMPSLDRVSRGVGNSMYHLDGPEQIQHLDMILSLEHVHAIQWVPLPAVLKNVPDRMLQDFADEKSLDIYKRCLKAGKKVVLTSAHHSQVETILNEVGCDGMFIFTEFDTRSEADEFVAYAKKNWIK